MNTASQSSGAEAVQVPYSVLGPGRRVEWEEIDDGIVLRVAAPFPPKHSRWFVHAIWLIIFALQSLFIPWGFFIFLALAAVLVLLSRSYLRFFSLADSMESGSAPAASHEPIVLEARGGRLFIYDPVPARKPNSNQWSLDLDKVVVLRLASPPWPMNRSERGELQFVLKDGMIRKALAGHEIGELKEIVRLLQPWVQKAQENPAHHAVVQPLVARPRVEFVEDADGFLLRIPVRRRTFRAPRGLRRAWTLIAGLCGLSWAILLVVAAAANKPRFNGAGVASGIFSVGFLAYAVTLAWAYWISRRRGEVLESEPALPILIEVQGDRLRRHDPQLFRKNLSLPLAQVVKVGAKPLQGDRSDSSMASLEVVLRSGRSVELIYRHALAELEELAPQLEERISFWKGKRLGR
jgi:hypothetical protein